MTIGEARSYLAHYLFRGEDVYKNLDMLSGGERARLALGMLALQDANFLLLDEPTNHLDIPTQEILQETLESFAGTILLVSHDRYLIDRLATQIWEVRDGRLFVFDGTLAEYYAARRVQQDAEREGAIAQRKESRNETLVSRQARGEERRRLAAVARAEVRVHELEARLASLEMEIQAASGGNDLNAMRRLGAAYEQNRTALDAAMEEWLALGESG
jgi:ATP-binding cassette subfamily F protein 3